MATNKNNELTEFPIYPIFGKTYIVSGVKWMCDQKRGWGKVRVNPLSWSELDARDEQEQMV